MTTQETLSLPPPEWSAHRRRLQDERGAGWLTAAGYLALVAVANLVQAGELDPTVAKIAAYGLVSVASVRRALRVARERGLLLVKPQFVKVDGRPQQRANLYTLAVPGGIVTPKPRPSRGDQRDRPSRKKKEESQKSMLTKGPVTASGGRVDLVAARARAFGAQWAEKYAARYG